MKKKSAMKGFESPMKIKASVKAMMPMKGKKKASKSKKMGY